MYLSTELPTWRALFQLFSCVGFLSYRKAHLMLCVVFAFCCSAVGGGKLHQGLAPVSSSPVYTVSPHPGVRSFPLLLGTGNTLLSETHLCAMPIRAAGSITEQPKPSLGSKLKAFKCRTTSPSWCSCLSFQVLEIQSNLSHNWGTRP